MKFIVIEIQEDENENVAILPAIQRSEKNDAESDFHSIAAVAAVSNVKKHSVVMLEDNGFMIKHESYDH